MTDTALKVTLMNLWMEVDKAYTNISAQGIAAHKACDTPLQHKLEKIAHELWQARKQVLIAVHRSTTLEGESK